MSNYVTHPELRKQLEDVLLSLGKFVAEQISVERLARIKQVADLQNENMNLRQRLALVEERKPRIRVAAVSGRNIA